MEPAEIDAWLEQSQGQVRTGGITAVDLLELPDALGQLMRLLIAGGPMTVPQLHQAVTTIEDGATWREEGLRYALNALCDRSWLHRTDEETAGPRYSVNFRNTARTPSPRRSRPILDFDL
jgi:hypothetical protein